RGAYGARVIVRDPDGNTAQRDGLGFVLQPPQPPTITEQQPTPGGLGGAHAAVSALVSDANIDAASIRPEVRVVPEPFEPADARVVFLTDTTRRVEFAQPPTFFHGEVVEVRVHAADTLGNDAETTWAFTVDGHAPVSFLTPEGQFLAGNVTILRGTTTLRLERSDEGSGLLATIVGAVNEDLGLASENTTITGDAPVSLTVGASPVYRGTGNYSIYVSSVDKAGNVEEPVRHRFLVDDSPPNVTATFEPGLITAQVKEVGAGIKEVKVQYWLTPSGEQGTRLMSPSPDRASWVGQIPDGERGTRVQYAVEASDLLGNVGRAGSAGQPLSALISNHKPVVGMSPPNGSLVRGNVQIEWAVTDRDDDPVQVSVSARPSTSDEARPLAAERGPQGSLLWDTRTVPDGVWVVAVEARDGFDIVRQEVQLDVANTNSKIAGVRVLGAEPGQAVRVEVTLYKPVQRAEAVLRLGPEEVARFPLLDDGAAPDRKARDGIFTGSFSPSKAGDYQVDLRVVFDDGRLEDQRNAGVARVQWGFPGVLVRDPLLLLVTVLVPAALVGAWVYRRYGPIRRPVRRK
ncbi:MAG TPA: choice-of-anchor X domain-containing protein, partial [Candidatus Thermoplasmatota archaeon]|nr:choice-of-anchor X domain-containing protein [Candidatus Thermoplasmatota archaeon]